MHGHPRSLSTQRLASRQHRYVSSPFIRSLSPTTTTTTTTTDQCAVVDGGAAVGTRFYTEENIQSWIHQLSVLLLSPLQKENTSSFPSH